MSYLFIVYGVVAISIGTVDRAISDEPCPRCKAPCSEHGGWPMTFALSLLWPLVVVLLLTSVGRSDVKS